MEFIQKMLFSEKKINHALSGESKNSYCAVIRGRQSDSLPLCYLGYNLL